METMKDMVLEEGRKVVKCGGEENIVWGIRGGGELDATLLRLFLWELTSGYQVDDIIN